MPIAVWHRLKWTIDCWKHTIAIRIQRAPLFERLLAFRLQSLLRKFCAADLSAPGTCSPGIGCSGSRYQVAASILGRLLRKRLNGLLTRSNELQIYHTQAIADEQIYRLSIVAGRAGMTSFCVKQNILSSQNWFEAISAFRQLWRGFEAGPCLYL